MPNETALTASALAALHGNGVEGIAQSRAHASRLMGQAGEMATANRGDTAKASFMLSSEVDRRLARMHANWEAANNLVKTIQVTHQDVDATQSGEVGKLTSALGSLGGIGAAINT